MYSTLLCDEFIIKMDGLMNQDHHSIGRNRPFK